jgi:hypothetical protein
MSVCCDTTLNCTADSKQTSKQRDIQKKTINLYNLLVEETASLILEKNLDSVVVSNSMPNFGTSFKHSS